MRMCCTSIFLWTFIFWFVDKRNKTRSVFTSLFILDIKLNEELKMANLYSLYFSLQESLRKENSILDIQLESAKLELAFIQEKLH